MSLTAGFIIGLAILAAVEGGAIGLQVRARHQAQAESAAVLATEQDARRVEVAGLTGELAECRAKVTPESLMAAAAGTTDALGAALAPELADVQARAALVQALPRVAITDALIEVASPQLLAAEAWLMRCEALQAIKETDRLGCGAKGEALEAMAAAISALPACPRCAECPESDVGP